MKSISVFCHLYYKDSFLLLAPYLRNLLVYETQFYFNLCSETDYYSELEIIIKSVFGKAIITCTPNVGKDIGGKLVLMDTYLKMGIYSEYLVFLHDKVSPHTSLGESWRKKLLIILEKENIELILNECFQTERAGLVGSKDMIMNEYEASTKSYTCTSHRELLSIRKKYSLNTSRHEFIGGTMFWVRGSIYQEFFTRYKPLAIRQTLDRGNVLDHHKGSLPHAWERAFSWIVLNKGYKIMGI